MTVAGYVALVGKPNAGKSTLMNTIMGTKISIVTPKPQTTRKRVIGIHSTDDTQIVFLDNPGFISPRYEMQRTMMSYVEESLKEADVITYIFDVDKFLHKDTIIENVFLKNLKEINKPSILLINKTDLVDNKKLILPVIEKYSEYFDEIIPISALHRKDADIYLEVLKKHLPESPFFYDPDVISSQPQRFFVSEIIREHIFMQFKEEIPYSVEVQINDFRERETGKWYISAEIIVERKSQKGIIIGKKGDKIKEIGQLSRADIEKHLGVEVYLELFVKVREKWRDKPSALKQMGY